MLYSQIPGVECPVSRIILGCSTALMNGGGDASAVLDAALKAGITTFDTARVYGKSESSLGRWLKTQRRGEIVVETKCSHPSLFKPNRLTRKDILADVERSLNELCTDYIDILLLHRDNAKAELAEVLETFDELKKTNRVRAFGASNWSYDRICEANEYAAAHCLPAFVVSSPQYSYAVQHKPPWGGGCVTLTDERAEKERKKYAESGLPVFAYSALAGGFLSGKFKSDNVALMKKGLSAAAKKGYLYEDNISRLQQLEKQAAETGRTVPQLAVEFVLSSELNAFAIVAASSPSRITALCAG